LALEGEAVVFPAEADPEAEPEADEDAAEDDAEVVA